jgi:hypothetical protein
MVQASEFEWSIWAVEQLQYGLVVRVTLDRLPNGRPGSEELHAAVLARFLDDDGPVIGFFKYQDLRGVGKTFELHTSTEPNEWRSFVEDLIQPWTEDWLTTETVVCLLNVRSWTESVASKLPLTSTLALQHFARLEGIVTGAYRARRNGDEGAILHAMEHRLNTIIINANADREQTFAMLL